MMSPLTFLNLPSKFKNICMIYPPTVKEVVQTPFFGQYIHLLSLTREEVWDSIIEMEDADDEAIKEVKNTALTPFEMLLFSSHENKATELIIKKAIYFFTKEEVTIDVKNKRIIFKQSILDASEKSKINKEAVDVNSFRMITEENYFDFQNAVRRSVGMTDLKTPDLVDLEEDPRVSRLKAKFRRKRKIVKEIKSKQSGSTFTTILAAVCCMKVGLTPLNIGEVSYGAVNLLMKANTHKSQYELDMAFLAGGSGDPKKIKPKYWVEMIEKEED